MKTLAYIVMAYMTDGSVKVKELFAEDLYRGEVGDAAKALKAQVALTHEANVIVGLNVETGQAVTLKNRWGPTGRQFESSAPKPLSKLV